MATRRRQELLLGVLAVVLAVVGYRAWTSTSAAPPPPSTGASPVAARRATAPGPATTAPEVHLESLEAPRPKPGAGDRDLFRFKPKAPPPAPRASAPPMVAPPTGPAPPPPPPPIPYKFIGLVESSPAKRIAVLSDGRSQPVYGREGDIIEGRYRIVRIGAESIEMEQIDGKGRQTIRLSGS